MPSSDSAYRDGAKRVAALTPAAFSFGAAFGVTAAVIAAGLLTAALSTETKHRPGVKDPDPDPSPGTSGISTVTQWSRVTPW